MLLAYRLYCLYIGLSNTIAYTPNTLMPSVQVLLLRSITQDVIRVCRLSVDAPAALGVAPQSTIAQLHRVLAVCQRFRDTFQE